MNFIVYAHHDKRQKSFVEYLLGRRWLLHRSSNHAVNGVNRLDLISHECNGSYEGSHYGGDFSFSTSLVFRGTSHHLLAVTRPVRGSRTRPWKRFCVRLALFLAVRSEKECHHFCTTYIASTHRYPVQSRRKVKPGFDVDDKVMMFNYLLDKM